MKKFLLVLVITMMMTGSIYACKTPEELMDNYFNDFSSGDIKKVERNYSFPLFVIQNGNKTIHDEISTFLDFKEISIPLIIFSGEFSPPIASIAILTCLDIMKYKL